MWMAMSGERVAPIRAGKVQRKYPGSPDQADSNAMVTPCSDGSFCCGNGTIGEQCCSDKKGIFIIDGNTANMNPSGASSASSAPAISTSSTASSAAFSTPSSTSSSVLSSAASPGSSSSFAPSHHVGAIAGGTIGGIIAVVLVIGITVMLTRRHMRNKQPEYLSELKAELPTLPADASKDPTRFELETRPHRVEVDGGRIGHELQ
ncbi:hypothetical protein MMC22_001948 [Lobaria immixta]|nr:hypothetical protein [Lobaria immixta]